MFMILAFFRDEGFLKVKWIKRMNGWIKSSEGSLSEKTVSLRHYQNLLTTYPVNIYLLKVNNRNTRESYWTCSKLTTKKPERRQWCRSCYFIVNFEHVIVSWVFLEGSPLVQISSLNDTSFRRSKKLRIYWNLTRIWKSNARFLFCYISEDSQYVEGVYHLFFKDLLLGLRQFLVLMAL